MGVSRSFIDRISIAVNHLFKLLEFLTNFLRPFDLAEKMSAPLIKYWRKGLMRSMSAARQNPGCFQNSLLRVSAGGFGLGGGRRVRA